MNGESQDDESDRDHAQEGQEPVGQSMKSLVTRGRQKEKKMWIKALWPHCAVSCQVRRAPGSAHYDDQGIIRLSRPTFHCEPFYTNA